MGVLAAPMLLNAPSTLDQAEVLGCTVNNINMKNLIQEAVRVAGHMMPLATVDSCQMWLRLTFLQKKD